MATKQATKTPSPAKPTATKTTKAAVTQKASDKAPVKAASAGTVKAGKAKIAKAAATRSSKSAAGKAAKAEGKATPAAARTKARTTTTSQKKSSAAKSSGRTKYSSAAGEQVGLELHKMHQGRLRSSSGEKVTNPKQAIAIALSEARRAGKKAPPNPNAPKKKK